MKVAQLIHHFKMQLPRYVAILAVVCISLVLAWQIYDTATSTTATPQQSRMSMQRLLSSSHALSFSKINTLFGQAPDISHTIIPDSKQNLQLRGVLNANNPYDSSAIIADETAPNSDKLYFVGDVVTGDTILKEVHPNYVVLSQGEHLERLFFADKDTSKIFNQLMEKASNKPADAPNHFQKYRATNREKLKHQLNEFQQLLNSR